MKTNVDFWSYLTQFFLEWEMFQTNFVEKMKTHILLSVTLFRYRAVYEAMWKKTVESCRPEMTMWRMRISSWVTKDARIVQADSGSDYDSESRRQLAVQADSGSDSDSKSRCQSAQSMPFA
jgi:hypothetical protein